MLIIGVDYHPSFQAIAFCMEETGECGEQELSHSDGKAEKFYRDLKQRGICVRVGMEATGYSRWFERLLAESPNGARRTATSLWRNSRRPSTLSSGATICTTGYRQTPEDSGSSIGKSATSGGSSSVAELAGRG